MTWTSYTGEEILYNALDENGELGGEPIFEDSVKQGILISSKGECQLLKFYYTDGFGWYFNNNKIIFILHECKVGITGKTLKGYSTCLRKALLQNIGYYQKIKNKQYIKFSKKLIELAKKFNYDDVNQFIIDHFGMFLITTPKFVSNVVVDDSIKELIASLEESMINTDKSPSKYWEDETMRNIMENFDIQNIPFEMMPDHVDLANTGEILNKLLN